MMLYHKIDADPTWFPGKADEGARGRPRRLLTRGNAAVVARTAMRMKAERKEPTYSRIVAACPKAAMNPATQKPFSKKRIYDVLRAQCYDEDPSAPWQHKARFAKKALTPQQQTKRLRFAEAVQARGHTNAWYYRSVLWTDLCNSILPNSEHTATEQALAHKGAKGWVSPGAELASFNLRGRKEVLKQNSWNTRRIWWAPLLTRGKLHVIVFDEAFPGEEAAGASVLVPKLRAALNARFPNAATQPSVIFVDRGKGFYNPASGAITEEFRTALRGSGFTAFWGENASIQPGHVQELMLHETAVGWLRHRLEVTLPKRPWAETDAAYARRLRACCADINAELDVEDLCWAFPKRIAQLHAKAGGRLKH